MPHVSSPVGSHTPVTGGLAKGGLTYAARVEAEAIQVFVTNPRGWALAAGDPRQDALLRAHVEEAGLPVFIHTPYLVNMGSPNPQTVALSVASVAHALARGAAIGAVGVVMHTGSAVSGGREAGLRRVRENLLPILGEPPEGAPALLLEPMAGQGQMLCARVEELGPYLEALDRHPKVGVCLDTCHAYAAGHDIATRTGMAAMLDALAAATGPGRLRLVHANDSLDVCGGKKDRHENIGAGHIGADPFGELFTHPVSAGVPLIVETPGKAEGHAKDIATLKALRPSRRAKATTAR
ncbi:MAG: deoxyribonuclease IV [Streptosporangiales bacterium]|nr:deoxyribonuclease IV [Streptosporangiales bacterium]